MTAEVELTALLRRMEPRIMPGEFMTESPIACERPEHRPHP